MTAHRGAYSASKRFNAERTALLNNVQEVLEEYEDHLPLTVRTICYILVGKGQLHKSEKDFATAGAAMTEARRAVDHPLHIPMRSIFNPDDISSHGGDDFGLPQQTPEEFIREKIEGITLYDRSSFGYSRYHWRTQPQIIVWCEARGLLPQVYSAVRRYAGVKVMSGGGGTTLRAWHNLGRDIAEQERKTVLLWVGDLDLGGIKIYINAVEDTVGWIEHYAGDPGLLASERIAVTVGQTEEYGLESAPEPKAYTHPESQIENARDMQPEEADWLMESARFGEGPGGKDILPAIQAEAMPPDTRSDIIREWVRAQIDREAWQESEESERRERGEIDGVLDGVNERMADLKAAVAEFRESELARLD